jgi:hypothetical protein
MRSISSSSVSPCTPSIPAAAPDASPPMRPRSNSATRRPARASSRATAQPITPPPSTATSIMCGAFSHDRTKSVVAQYS